MLISSLSKLFPRTFERVLLAAIFVVIGVFSLQALFQEAYGETAFFRATIGVIGLILFVRGIRVFVDSPPSPGPRFLEAFEIFLLAAISIVIVFFGLQVLFKQAYYGTFFLLVIIGVIGIAIYRNLRAAATRRNVG